MARLFAQYLAIYGKKNIEHLLQLYWKDENKEKEAGNGLFKKERVLKIYGTLVVGSSIGLI